MIREECLSKLSDTAPKCPVFKIINPSHTKRVKGQQKFGRQQEWGFADSHSHSDFNSLHKLILKYIRVDLIKTM